MLETAAYGVKESVWGRIDLLFTRRLDDYAAGR